MTTLYEQHHITLEREGDCLTLRQIDHSGNEAAICLHASQLRLLAEECGLLAPAPLPAVPLDLAGGPTCMDSLDVEKDDDGTVVLSQTRVRGMGGTDDEIHLHPLQVAWLAAKLAALVGTTKPAQGAPEQLELAA